MTQHQIEIHLRFTPEEVTWLNDHKGDPFRDHVIDLLGIQVASYDAAGFALLEEAVFEMRQHLQKEHLP